jgi:hypothetical protein
LTKLVLEKASASGITLKWNGGDAKDELVVVSSELNFDMLSPDATDATFINLFTGDEERFRVELRVEGTNDLLWQGHIVPDQYSEPYKNGCFFVSFSAMDGLGRLKGKYLPNEYYSEEKSVIDIYCQILKLTGLELDLYFNPAIENFINKNWNAIFIDTANFAEKNKKQTAFKILETLLKDTLCICYQADNRWYIDGLNTRHLRKVNYKIFGSNGAYKGTVDYNRLLKSATALPTPQITMIPPYNEITITHAKIKPSLPTTLSKESNDGWAVVTGVVGEIDPSDWMSNGGLYAKCKKPDYYVTLYNKAEELSGSNLNYPHDNTQWISLRKKLFMAKGQKATMGFKFKVAEWEQYSSPPSNLDLWKNPFKYEIIFNGEVLYTNWELNPGDVTDQEKVIFDSNTAEAELSIEHIFKTDGLLDFKFWRPFGTVMTNHFYGYEIREAKIDMIDFQEEDSITDVINAEFTIDKEVELTFGNDKSGISKGFLLSKLKNATTFFNEIEVPILYGFTKNGKHYSVVQLKGANLIAENLYSVYKSGVLIVVNGVTYNFENGEQMVVETPVPYTSGSFFVKKYAVDDVIEYRTNWLQWTDAIYKIENFSYAQTVANIYRRLFNVAHEKLDMTVFNAIKFNDIILFHYVFEKDFYLLNCAWNLDDNKSTLTLARSNYKNENTNPEDENIPPIVLAGDDIYLENTATTTDLLATAFDPDGYIVSQVWTLISGDTTIVITSPNQLATALQNLIGDTYTLQIKVTDNDGATASDSLQIFRIKEHIITLDLIDEVIETNLSYPSIDRTYQLNFTPDLPVGMSVTLHGTISIASIINGSYGVHGDAGYVVTKNGAEIESNSVVSSVLNIPLTINYIVGDVITIRIYTDAYAGDSGSGDTAQVNAQINLNTININSGQGTFSGLPINKQQQVTA